MCVEPVLGTFRPERVPPPGEQFKKTPPNPAQCGHPVRRGLRKHSVHPPTHTHTAPDVVRKSVSGTIP